MYEPRCPAAGDLGIVQPAVREKGNTASVKLCLDTDNKCAFSKASLKQCSENNKAKA